eukprot:scaffold34623_cov274-Amphora_coffeaeformis.AAC.11
MALNASAVTRKPRGLRVCTTTGMVRWENNDPTFLYTTNTRHSSVRFVAGGNPNSDAILVRPRNYSHRNFRFMVGLLALLLLLLLFVVLPMAAATPAVLPPWTMAKRKKVADRTWPTYS